MAQEENPGQDIQGSIKMFFDLNLHVHLFIHEDFKSNYIYFIV